MINTPARYFCFSIRKAPRIVGSCEYSYAGWKAWANKILRSKAKDRWIVCSSLFSNFWAGLGQKMRAGKSLDECLRLFFRRSDDVLRFAAYVRLRAREQKGTKTLRAVHYSTEGFLVGVRPFALHGRERIAKSDRGAVAHTTRQQRSSSEWMAQETKQQTSRAKEASEEIMWGFSTGRTADGPGRGRSGRTAGRTSGRGSFPTPARTHILPPGQQRQQPRFSSADSDG